MQVLTIHCSNAVLSDKDIGPLSIKYTYDGLSIGSATQSPLIEHAVTTNVGPQPGIYRCVCTTRLTVVPRHGKSFSDHKELDRASSFDGTDHVRTKFDHNEIAVVKRSISGNRAIKSKRSRIDLSAGSKYDTPHANTKSVKRIRNDEVMSAKKVTKKKRFSPSQHVAIR
jgi:hypothetical protein